MNISNVKPWAITNVMQASTKDLPFEGCLELKFKTGFVR
jgi:hypothetical protein